MVSLQTHTLEGRVKKRHTQISFTRSTVLVPTVRLQANGRPTFRAAQETRPGGNEIAELFANGRSAENPSVCIFLNGGDEGPPFQVLGRFAMGNYPFAKVCLCPDWSDTVSQVTSCHLAHGSLVLYA